jgi:hypothetical protein
MGRSQFLGFLLWTVVLCAQRPPNRIVSANPFGSGAANGPRQVSPISSVSTLSETETDVLYLPTWISSGPSDTVDALSLFTINSAIEIQIVLRINLDGVHLLDFLLSGTPSFRSLRYVATTPIEF